MKRSWILPLSLGTLAGCATLAGPVGTSGEGTATLTVQPTLVEGGLHTQTLRKAWSRADVDHLVLVLSVPGGRTVQRDIASSSLSVPVVFKGLRDNRIYRIQAKAYRAPGENEANLISVDDQSYRDLTVSREDRPTLETLPVRLRDEVFSGEAPSSVAIASGSLVPGGSIEAKIVKGPPLGDFVTLDATMSYGVEYPAPVQVGNKVYLIGGFKGGNWSTDIQVATLDADGDIGPFSRAQSTLNTAMYSPKAIIIGHFVYVFDQSASAIERAAINDDGTLGAFESSGQSPPLQRCGYFKNDKYVYTFGGFYNSSNNTDFYRAPINTDGSIGSFSPYSTDLSPVAFGPEPLSILIGDRMYLFKTYPFSGEYTDATCNFDQSGNLINLEKQKFNIGFYRVYLALIAENLYALTSTAAQTAPRDTNGQLMGPFDNYSNLNGRTIDSPVYFKTPSYLYAFGCGQNYEGIQRAPINE